MATPLRCTTLDIEGRDCPPPYEAADISVNNDTNAGACVEGAWPDAPPTYQDAMGGPALVTYRDFIPSPIDVAKSCRYENFSSCVRKANDWLVQNSNMKVQSCEVLKLKRSEKRLNTIDTDASTSLEYLSFRKSYINALRIWLLPRSYDESQAADKIGIQDIVPRCLGCIRNSRNSRKNTCRYQNLKEAVNEFNQLTREFPLQGSIVSVQTISRCVLGNEHVIDTECTFWMESRQTNTYANVIRVFYIMGAPSYQPIDFTNFKPNFQHGAKNIFDHCHFDSFTSVAKKGDRWVSEQSDINVLNFQSIDCKVRRHSLERTEDTKVFDPNQTFYDEKGGKTATAFLRVLRVYYTKKHPMSPSQQLPIRTLTCKTFKPCQLVEGDMLINIDSYEDTINTKKRMKAWLREAGVDSRQIISVESAPILLYDGVQDGDPEEMMKYHRSDIIRMVLTVIRVYFTGSYREPLPDSLPPIPALKKRKNPTCSLS